MQQLEQWRESVNNSIVNRCQRESIKILKSCENAWQSAKVDALDDVFIDYACDYEEADAYPCWTPSGSRRNEEVRGGKGKKGHNQQVFVATKTFTLGDKMEHKRIKPIAIDDTAHANCHYGKIKSNCNFGNSDKSQENLMQSDESSPGKRALRNLTRTAQSSLNLKANKQVHECNGDGGLLNTNRTK